MVFNIAVRGALRPLMMLIGVTGVEKRQVELTDTGLELRFGWWRDHLPYEDIAGVEARGWRHIYGYGMRIAPGSTLGLVGTSKGVVSVRLGDKRPFKVPFAMGFEQVAISMEEPEAFMGALRERLEAA